MSTKQITQFNWQRLSANQNWLQGKVVFIIGYDMAVLQSLVTQFAQKGADIVLVCRQLPGEVARAMNDMVQFYGRRLLLIQQIEEDADAQSLVMEMIKNKLGRLDIFIDLSTQKMKPYAMTSTNKAEFTAPNWSFTWAFLEESAHKP